MRSEILPPSFTHELERLRTDVEPMDRDTVLAALRAEYDRPIEDIFDAIDDNPLGSASVAQVHKARLVTGELVAIKVQRPHVQETMAQDISIMRSLARYMSRFMGQNQFLDLQSVVDELWQSFREETDFLVEARNLEEFRRNNAGCVYLECPKPHPVLCTRHVVVMDYVEGIAIDDTATLAAAGYDCAEIGEKLVEQLCHPDAGRRLLPRGSPPGKHRGQRRQDRLHGPGHDGQALLARPQRPLGHDRRGGREGLRAPGGRPHALLHIRQR